MASNASLIKRLDATGVPLLVARLFVGGMFGWLAYNKLLDPINFLKLVHQYGIFPNQPPLLINVTAAVLPWLEMLCAAALLLGVGLRGAAALVAGMLLFFTPMLALHAWGLLQEGKAATYCGVRFDCGCGTGEQYICPKLLENVALLLAVLIPLFSTSRRLCLSAVFRRTGAVSKKM